jgi:hypothetical protein
MRSPIDAHEIHKAIEKTGFPLEHRVTDQFRKAKWSVISNRYYVDDLDGRARELDLIAFKLHKHEELDVVTAVLIGCKKDASKTWAFLSRPKDPSDPNVDWQPVHVWSDLEPLRSYLRSTEWRSGYVKSDKRAAGFAFDVKRDFFAFQEISPPGQQQKTTRPEAKAPPAKGASANNDTAIFNSITGLLKALDSEMAALPERVPGRKRLYMFNLAVVVDAPMVDVRYGGQGTEAEVHPIDQLLLLSRFMVQRRHFSSQIHFVSSEKVDAFISELDHVAKTNGSYFGRLVGASYGALKTNSSVQSHFAPLVKRRLTFHLNEALRKQGVADKVTELGLSYRTEGATLAIEIDVDETATSTLNDDPDIQKTTAKVLKDICRYSGAFRFDPDIPF